MRRHLLLTVLGTAVALAACGTTEVGEVATTTTAKLTATSTAAPTTTPPPPPTVAPVAPRTYPFAGQALHTVTLDKGTKIAYYAGSFPSIRDAQFATLKSEGWEVLHKEQSASDETLFFVLNGTSALTGAITACAHEYQSPNGVKIGACAGQDVPKAAKVRVTLSPASAPPAPPAVPSPSSADATTTTTARVDPD